LDCTRSLSPLRRLSLSEVSEVKYERGALRKPLRGVKRTVATTAAIITACVVILTTLAKLGDFAIHGWNQLFGATRGAPDWYWARVCLVCAEVATVSLALGFIWRIRIGRSIRLCYRESTIWFMLRCIGTMMLLGGFMLILLLIVPLPDMRGQYARILFPHVEVGPIVFRTYANNGEAQYLVADRTPEYGPDGYARILLKTYGRTVEESCGWVAFFIRGTDFSDHRELRFLIRGERGGERIGVKAKDARGVEVSLILNEHYLRKGGITTDWQEAIVPLEDFGNVDFGLMENVSIFTDGRLAGTRAQRIYVGRFEFR